MRDATQEYRGQSAHSSHTAGLHRRSIRSTRAAHLLLHEVGHAPIDLAKEGAHILCSSHFLDKHNMELTTKTLLCDCRQNHGNTRGPES